MKRKKIEKIYIFDDHWKGVGNGLEDCSRYPNILVLKTRSYQAFFQRRKTNSLQASGSSFQNTIKGRNCYLPPLRPLDITALDGKPRMLLYETMIRLMIEARKVIYTPHIIVQDESHDTRGIKWKRSKNERIYKQSVERGCGESNMTTSLLTSSQHITI